MVSIIERNSYLTGLRKNTKFELLFSLIFSNPPKSDFETNAEVDEVYKNVIFSIAENDKNRFLEWYKKISARQPNEYSPFTNDNLLLFVLIVGVLKFDQNSEWIRNVIEVRKNTDEEKNLITLTFKNVLNGNFKSRDNAFQIILVIQELTGKELISWSEKKILYTRLANSNFPLNKSELLNITGIRSFDSIILEGDKSDESYFKYLREFEKGFLKRTKIFSQIIYFLSCLILIGVIGWFVFNPKYGGLMGKFDTLFGIIGVAIFSFWKSKSVISWIDKRVQKFLGYPHKNNQDE